MRSILGGLAIAVALVGCSDPLDSAPTCDVAMTHYYAAGCSFARSNPPNPGGLTFEIGACTGQVRAESEGCHDEAATYLECMNNLPMQTPGTCVCDFSLGHPNGCACSAELDAMLFCKQ